MSAQSFPRDPGRTSAPDPGERYRRWEKATEIPMAGLALIFLGVYAYLVISNTRSTPVSWPEVLMLMVWILFAVHYAVSLILVNRRGHWFLTHLHVLAMTLLPFLRPLLLLRLFNLWVLRRRSPGSALRGRVSIYVAGTSLLLVLVAALGVLDMEQNADGANITSFGDAVWWSFVTMSSVGYGDYYPVTAMGRLMAVGLMFVGIALIGSVTASIASWFVERIGSAESDPGGRLTHGSDGPPATGAPRGSS